MTDRLSPMSKLVNPQAPVAQKVANEVVFRRFQGEGVEFFADPLRFLMSIFWKVPILALPALIFQLVKRKKRCLFTLTNL